MCGIVGMYGEAPKREQIETMLSLVRHRGPNESGAFLDEGIGLGVARLILNDELTGKQPLATTDGLVVLFNGEIFNRADLERRFDLKGSEVQIIAEAYRRFGADFPKELEGQFAIAVFDKKSERLYLARDRFGICPLYFSQQGNALLFASEIKAIASQLPGRTIDLEALDQVFTFWTTLPGRTIFKGIEEVRPGEIVLFHRGKKEKQTRYWNWAFPSLTEKFQGSFAEAKSEFETQLKRAVEVRLRADVKSAAYLSGGIDSSTLVTIAKSMDPNVSVYSIAFEDAGYDESEYQDAVAQRLSLQLHRTKISRETLSADFSSTVSHAENVLFRTAPAPLFALSKSVNADGGRFALSGEGADEILLGYDLFRELKLRRFWARQPESKVRPRLFEKLYSYLPQFQDPRFRAMAIDVFKSGMGESDLFYSHRPRWRNNSANKN